MVSVASFGKCIAFMLHFYSHQTLNTTFRLLCTKAKQSQMMDEQSREAMGIKPKSAKTSLQ